MSLKATLIVITSTALLLFLPFSVANSTLPVGAYKVNVNFYYESLCQSCRDYITADLQHLLHANLHPILNLRMIPWGNARIINGTFLCQHGPDECYLNTVQVCAIHKWPDLRTQLDFIQCSVKANMEWKSCVTSETARELQQCATSNIGKHLQLGFAYETQSLNPPHEFVPWVTVNDVPLRKDIFNIVKNICDAYKGPNPPVACKHKNPADNRKFGVEKSEFKTCVN